MTRVKRRLAAILCADVVQYSRLMERDEDGTLDRLRGYRAAIGGLVAAREGRIVNTWGDAVIVEFASVVEAVRCAAEIQGELAERNAALPPAERMVFRIGINLGDVMVEGDDIYGDGVNIAARLQQVAEPGGIVISGPVHDQVKSRLAMGFDALGAQTVKNISDPVATYKVRVGGDNAGAQLVPAPVSDGPSPQEPAARRPFGVALHGFAAWYRAQPGRIRMALGGIGFFFLLNAMTGLGTLWFQWPSLPFLAILLFGGWRRSDR
ncbi:adenylate/guanylate cyclase domain-containing protein [Stappia taiwanensis]|uniref:Adenylate/guanylate cyclase domain-containing protein n=1 Tax=Stappia taiwanensis TaxID=992267 RepID=A0A838XJE7_9HYPH|nr:adenylate/guanylate cyclase domain-containing protein [Stappia taiwanensis]MBA4610655.1 adenylate/guanylate cyclase domain-containing protein [Stappia taiwanensis]GGE83254.1 adenylate cyclase [Stappia taiwanensis]